MGAKLKNFTLMPLAEEFSKQYSIEYVTSLHIYQYSLLCRSTMKRKKTGKVNPKDISTKNKDTCSSMFIAALFIIGEAGKNPDLPQQRNGYRKCGTFTQWNTTQLLKTINL